FLSSLGLESCRAALEENGYETCAHLLSASDDHLKEAGLKPGLEADCLRPLTKSQVMRRYISPVELGYDGVVATVESFIEQYRPQLDKALLEGLAVPFIRADQLAHISAASSNVFAVPQDIGCIPTLTDSSATELVPSLLIHGLPTSASNPTLSGVADLEEALVANAKVLYVLGTSGAGKTRTNFELLCRRYGCYITLAKESGPGSNDASKLMTKITPRLPDENPEVNSQTARHWILSLVMGRLTLLRWMLKRAGSLNLTLTPSTLLLLQLLPSYYLPNHDGDITDDFFVHLARLYRYASTDALASGVGKFLTNITSMTSTRTVCVLDEVQAALQTPLKFESPSSKERRPLFTPMIKGLYDATASFTTLPIVLSGTGTCILKEKIFTESGIAKSEKTFRLVVTVERSFEKFVDYLDRFVRVESKDEAMVIYRKLKGRPRFLARFIEMSIVSQLKWKQRALLELVEGTEDLTIGEVEGSGLRSRIGKMRLAHPEVYDVARRAVAAYMYGGNPIVVRGDMLELVEYGFAQLVRGSHGTTQARIDEPLVALTMARYSRDINQPLKDDLLATMRSLVDNPSACGSLWEYYITEELQRLFDGSRSLAHHPLFAGLSKLPPMYQHAARIWRPNPARAHPHQVCRRASSAYGLIEFLKNPTAAFFLPEDIAGPDLVFFLEINTPTSPIIIPCFVQAKLRSSLKSAERAHALRTTVPEKLYGTQTEAAGKPIPAYKEALRQEALGILNGRWNRAVGVLRMVVGFPVEMREDSSVVNGKDVSLVVDPRNAQHILGSEHMEFLSALKLEELEVVDDEES
ncbi:hypothetical protein HK097_003250, partial [Rhizophlyctis rosea]